MPASTATLIVGLGNPGAPYAGNRHNIGHMVADVLAGRMHEKFRSHKAGADVAEGRLALGGSRLIVAKLHCYMNVSGGPTAALLRFFGLTPDDLIVIHDELDIPFGTLKVKKGGGEGGHNGLKSISASIGTRDYVRVRAGIGRPPGRMDPADYVLKNFATAERDELGVLLEDAADAAAMIVTDGLTATQNRFHPVR